MSRVGVATPLAWRDSESWVRLPGRNACNESTQRKVQYFRIYCVIPVRHQSGNVVPCVQFVRRAEAAGLGQAAQHRVERQEVGADETQAGVTTAAADTTPTGGNSDDQWVEIRQ